MTCAAMALASGVLVRPSWANSSVQGNPDLTVDLVIVEDNVGNGEGAPQAQFVQAQNSTQDAEEGQQGQEDTIEQPRLCPPPSEAIHLYDIGTHRRSSKFRVGVDGIRGFEAAIQEYSLVFGEYLTKTAGRKFDPPLEFEMVPMTPEGLSDSGQTGDIDFFFANPGVFSCLNVELDASALATVIARLNLRGKVHDLDVFAGVMIARADRKDIQTVRDFKNQIIAAGALSMILGGQVQFYEMGRAGVSYVLDPKQVVFTYNQFDVVSGVLDGKYDVGFVRTDQIERGVDKNGNPLDTSLFNVIQPKIYVMENADLFPFLHSTEIFPEFAFGALPHVNKDVAEEVQKALFALGHHAAAAEGLETCYEEKAKHHCDSLPFPNNFVTHVDCDTTHDLAWTALNASRAGSIAGFRTARSYSRVRTIHEAGRFMIQDENGNWFCPRAENLYEGISCPAGYIKVSEDAYSKQCEAIGLDCEEGYDCFCKPCRLEIDVYSQKEGSANDGIHQAAKACTTETLCAITEQTKPTVFRVYDNSHREKVDIRAVAQVAGTTTEIPVFRVNGTSSYEFTVSSANIGTAAIQVYANDIPIPTSPINVQFIPRNCVADYEGESRVPTDEGLCVCDGGDLEIAGRCLQSVVIFSIIASIIIAIALCIAYVYLVHKRNLSDQVWLVNAEELHFNEPLDIIGQGSFGQVVLAEYRGTKVAIKRVIRSEIAKRGMSVGSTKAKPVSSLVGTPTPSIDRDDAPSSEEEAEVKSPSKNANFSCSLDSDIEVGRSKGSGFGTETVDLELLGKLSLGKRNSKWTNVCPGGYGEDEHHRIKSNILGTTTGGSVSKPLAAQIFTCLDKQRQRKQEFIVEMRLLSRLRHPCITTVMGAVLSPFHDPMLVMEYMEYGSLHDLLQNETMYAGGDIILQIMRDISQGLRYLHSSKPPICHGDLKARNILIDSRFRAKVADFGLSEKKKNGLTGTPYFMAPEYLRGRPYSPACDIYSMAIIIWEIYARKDPYEGEPLMKVLREVCDPCINRRPPVPETMPQKIVDTMKKCWSADPFYRPQAKDLDMILMDLNINEAEPVTSRDQKLANKKDKKMTQDLLYDVFPRHIADALKVGRKVEPESHELVTIFFSDIVGFTSMSQRMSPMKVSNMLDRLYSCLDKLARAHKVFKVETIGDAYMGVTNLDQTQDDEHVRNIAEFAVDAVEAASKTLIDEDDPKMGCIKIRVGFHSGPVVSNVIGSLNPRYSLVGDTVNTASRMESNSKANRILCSQAAADLLRDQAPKMLVRKRGKVDVKGKGQMMTFWVDKPIVYQGPTSPDGIPVKISEESEENTESSVHVDFVDGV